MEVDVNCFERISFALKYYQARGYTFVDVPAMIPKADVETLCPDKDRIFYVEGSDLALVGSAEQSLFHLTAESLLKRGVYVAFTPCYRREPTLNRLTQREFYKVELFSSDSTKKTYYDMIEDASLLFTTLSNSKLKPKKFDAGEHGLDLVTQRLQIELGSYGSRVKENIVWHYGTGIAEPRFSVATEVEGSFL